MICKKGFGRVQIERYCLDKGDRLLSLSYKSRGYNFLVAK